MLLSSVSLDISARFHANKNELPRNRGASLRAMILAGRVCTTVSILTEQTFF